MFPQSFFLKLFSYNEIDLRGKKIEHDSKFVKQSLYVFIIFSLQFV